MGLRGLVLSYWQQILLFLILFWVLRAKEWVAVDQCFIGWEVTLIHCIGPLPCIFGARHDHI